MTRRASRREILRRLEALESLHRQPAPPVLDGQEAIPGLEASGRGAATAVPGVRAVPRAGTAVDYPS